MLDLVVRGEPWEEEEQLRHLDHALLVCTFVVRRYQFLKC
jgi:hypothetical protein